MCTVATVAPRTCGSSFPLGNGDKLLGVEGGAHDPCFHIVGGRRPMVVSAPAITPGCKLLQVMATCQTVEVETWSDHRFGLLAIVVR